MAFELPASLEKALRNLAVAQGRDVRDLVEEAIRQYLEAAAITDLDYMQVAKAQFRLVGELHDIEVW